MSGVGDRGGESLSLPSNEAEFQRFIERIDQRLIRKEIPIAYRQLAAIAEVCWELGENRAVPEMREPEPGSYSGDDLLIRTINWYDERYGESQQTYLGPGRALVKIRGDIWEVEYPFVSGQVAFVSGESADAPGLVYLKEDREVLTAREIADSYPEISRLNVFNYISRFPDSLVASLRQHELKGILYVFCKHWLPLQELLLARRYKYVGQARGNLDAGVKHMLMDPPQSGLAKYAAAMAAEKLLKSYIYYSEERVEKTHKLNRLAEQAESVGSFTIQSKVLELLVTTADVRYGEHVPVDEAFRAVNTAIELAGTLALYLRNDFPDVEDEE